MPYKLMSLIGTSRGPGSVRAFPFAPHLGLANARDELLSEWRPYKVRPSPNESPGRRLETGTLQHELLAGFVAAVEYIESVGWDAIRVHERMLGERFLAGLPDAYTLHGLSTMDGRVASFAFTHDSRSPARSQPHSATAASPSGTATTTPSR